MTYNFKAITVRFVTSEDESILSEALKSWRMKEWIAAMNEEFDTLLENKTWEEFDGPNFDDTDYPPE